MKRYCNFLHTEVYRRAFITYVCIALLFMGTILGFAQRDIRKTARENFIREAGGVCEEVDRQAGDLVSALDQFASQVYASPGLSDDFFRFFGATAEQYTSRRLVLGQEPEVSILQSFKGLVLNSSNAIRHIIFYARENVVDLEFNDQGDSRHRIITTEEAEQICRSGCVYQKDIHKGSSYYGKISVVLDLTRFLQGPHEEMGGRGLCLVLNHRIISWGQERLPDTVVRDLLAGGGFPKRIQGEKGTLFCTAYTSHSLPYSILYMTRPGELLSLHYWKLLALALCCVAAFGTIALVLIRLFSRDTTYIWAILRSMARAEKGNFTPVEVAGFSPEYDAIIKGLNNLYTHLDNVIEREYKLTISQQKTQMNMLSTQLNPHFLYNTLERIRMRAVLNHDPDVAEATAGLGLLYRNIVKTEPVIPMSRELEITRQYLDLMTFLYGDQFMYYFDVDESLQGVETPKIWMQPIVENFFKHNFQQDETIKVVVVELNATDTGFEGRFFDNIGYVEPERLREINDQLQQGGEESQGIGLGNVLHRLRLFYGSGLEIRMENNDPAGVCIRVIYREKRSESCIDC